LPAAAGHEQSPPPAGPPLPQSRAQFGGTAGVPPRRDGAPIAPSLRPSATTGSDVADFTRGLLTALLQDWEPGEVKTYGQDNAEIGNGVDGLIDALVTLERAHVAIVASNREDVHDLADAVTRCGHRVSFVAPASWQAAAACKDNLKPEPDLVVATAMPAVPAERRLQAPKSSEAIAFTRGMVAQMLERWTAVDFTVYGRDSTEVGKGHDGLINALAAADKARVVVVTPHLNEMTDDIVAAARTCGHSASVIDPGLWQATVGGLGQQGREAQPELIIFPGGIQ